LWKIKSIDRCIRRARTKVGGIDYGGRTKKRSNRSSTLSDEQWSEREQRVDDDDGGAATEIQESTRDQREGGFEQEKGCGGKGGELKEEEKEAHTGAEVKWRSGVVEVGVRGEKRLVFWR
jgi:hypothetical protein